MIETNHRNNENIGDTNKKTLRLNRIIFKLKKDKIITINELAKFCGVTKMTIYRDVMLLNERNIVTVINGVVMYNKYCDKQQTYQKNEVTYDLPTEIHRNVDEKIRIVNKAIELIEEGDNIYIDSGSTMEYLSRNIPENKNLIVGCHAFYVLVNIQMKKGCDIIFPGGYFHEETLVFECEESINLLRKNRFNKAFFAAGGVSEQLGVTCSNPYVVNIKKAIIASSHTKILLVDSSKFGNVQNVYFADIDEFDIIITDSKISSEFQNIFKEKGIKLYIV